MHRDVKPANILLAPDRSGAPYGRVLLTDYGISVQPDAGETRYTLASVLVGTAGYLAPERATGGAPTAAADLFSLGCTLYHAVEGRGPFERESHLAEVTAVVMEEPRPAVRAGALEPVLAALLAKDPGQRLSAAQAEAALSGIVAPQAEAYSRTQTDLGSQPPWAGVPAPSAGPHGFAPPTAGPGFGPTVGPPGTDVSPDPHGYFGPPLAPSPPSAPVRRRRERSHALRAVLACGLGMVLALGGVWYALADRTTTPGVTGAGRRTERAWGWRSRCGTATVCSPTGRVPSVTRARPGCRWIRPAGTRRRTVRCWPSSRPRRRTRRGGWGLRHARSGRGRSGTGSRTCGASPSCRRRTVSRPPGGAPPVWCWARTGRCTGRSAATARRARRSRTRRPCRSGTVWTCAPTGTPGWCPARERTTRRCSDSPDWARTSRSPRRAPSPTWRAGGRCHAADYGFDPSVYTAGSWTSEGPWKNGTHFVVCTVRRQNGGTMEGDEP